MPTESQLTGRFVWQDLMTADAEKSRAFYGTLFPEWKIKGVDIGDGRRYHVIEIAGHDAGGIVELSDDASVPSHWISSIAANDCDIAVTNCSQLGGKTVVPAVSVPGVGKFAVLQDDQAAVFKPFELAKEITFADKPDSGQFVWRELQTHDAARARSFYQAMFGWSSFETPMDDGTYVMFRINEQDVAGAQSMPDNAESPPNWLVYLYASDIDERSAKVETLGGRTYVEPRDIPGIGRFAVHSDSTGAAFALFRGS